MKVIPFLLLGLFSLFCSTTSSAQGLRIPNAADTGLQHSRSEIVTTKVYRFAIVESQFSMGTRSTTVKLSPGGQWITFENSDLPAFSTHHVLDVGRFIDLEVFTREHFLNGEPTTHILNARTARWIIPSGY